jgi:septal ring-binding cell division protein DamX
MGYQDAAVPVVGGANLAPAERSEGLGSIEALRNFEVPEAQFPPIEERIAQKQEKKKPLSAPPARQTRKTGLIAAVAVGAIAIVAAGGWYYLKSTRGEELVTSAAPVTGRVEPSASETVRDAKPATTATEPATSTAPPASARPEPNAMIEMPASAPAKPPVVAAPPPTTQSKAAAPAPVQQPVATKPPTPSPAPASSSKYAAQAQQYAKESATVPFTVQFALVCRDASIEGSIRNGGSKIWFVPITHRGEACYKVYWGRYSTREQAERGIAEIPASLRGGKPSVISPGTSGR